MTKKSKSLYIIFHPTQQFKSMKAQKLGQKVTSIKAASDFQHKLISTIHHIMFLKRKAQYEYSVALENINREIQKYLINQNGFLNQIMKAFQSYISVVYHNQQTLIEGYDKQILSFLAKAKESTFEKDIMEKVRFVDGKVEECREKIRQCKKQIKQNEEDLQVISSQVKFKTKLSELKDSDKKTFAQKYTDISILKHQNEQILEQHIDGMMDLTMLHNQTLEELDNYESIYLEQKANDVYDNFMRTFVLEVAFIRSMQFDVTGILQKVEERRDEGKRVEIEGLRKRMKKQRGIGEVLWEGYKKWTEPTYDIDIHEEYINSKIRDKWKRVCEYYNQATY